MSPSSKSAVLKWVLTATSNIRIAIGVRLLVRQERRSSKDGVDLVLGRIVMSVSGRPSCRDGETRRGPSLRGKLGVKPCGELRHQHKVTCSLDQLNM